MKNSSVFLKEIFSLQLQPLKSGTDRLLRRKDPEALHDLRVNLLRAKFALKLLRTYAGEDQNKMVQSRLKKFQDLMGETRNLDILLVRLEKDFQNLDMPFSKKHRLRSSVQIRRNKAWKEMLAALKSDEYAQALQELRGLALVDKTKASVAPKEAARISHIILTDALDKVIERKKSAQTPDDLHQVRIAFKELRYACEFFQPFYRGMKGIIDFVVRYQDILGDRQDAVGATRQLSGMPAKPVIRRVIPIEQDFARDKRRQFEKLWKKNPVNRLKFYDNN